MVTPSGPSPANLLFCMFSFHVPVKFGLVCAIAVNAHRGASKKAVSRDLVVIMVLVSRFLRWAVQSRDVSRAKPTRQACALPQQIICCAAEAQLSETPFEPIRFESVIAVDEPQKRVGRHVARRDYE